MSAAKQISDSSEPLLGGSKVVIRVAAASDLRRVFPQIQSAFQNAHPSVEIQVTFGSSGNFASQILQQAPFDLFLSADRELVQKVIDAGRTVPNSEFPYARGRLALWLANESSIDPATISLALLRDRENKKIAIANPRHAPYGRAATQALQNAGVFAEIESRLVFADNVSQAVQFVDTNAADVGIVAYSLLIDRDPQESGVIWLIPQDLHTPLEQWGVVIGGTPHAAVVQQLCDVISGDVGQTLLKQNGFESAEK